MKLKKLLDYAGILYHGKNPEIKDITEDSRAVTSGSLFFAVTGFSTDGNRFIPDAVRKGAVAVISDNREKAREYSKKYEIPVIYVENIREKEALIASKFFGEPSKKLRVIGITGTNGKTTTSYILYTVLNRLGRKTAITGTVEYGTPESRKPASRTTPSAIEYNRILKEFLEEGVEFVVSEVSSHGLELHRVSGIRFEGAIFTNLTQDHLDFHGNIYNYFLSKEKLFFLTENVSLVNFDDPSGKVLSGMRSIFPCKTITYGKHGKVKIESVENRSYGSEITLYFEKKKYRIRTNLKGDYNAYNVAAAFGLLVALGFEGEEIKDLFDSIRVPGRLEEVKSGIFVDYAHTPDALEKVLTALSKIKKGKLITVFGCGGDRDREKRPIMGKLAEKLSDRVIITNDNPRSEDPQKIIEDILSGIENREKVAVIPDRREAIFRALSEKEEDDIVLIAGKGHENYQIIGDKKLEFSDREVVEEFYESRGSSKDS